MVCVINYCVEYKYLFIVMHFMVFLAYIVVLRYTVLHSNYECSIALRLC